MVAQARQHCDLILLDLQEDHPSQFHNHQFLPENKEMTCVTVVSVLKSYKEQIFQ